MAFRDVNDRMFNLSFVDSGRSGVILRLNPTRVLKAPLIVRNPGISEEDKFVEDFLINDNINFLENEKETFRRLGHYEHIVEWYETGLFGIEMKYMANGSLSRFRQSRSPSKQRLYSWITSIAAAIAYAHSRNVIVGDIRSQNILIDDDESAKLCDFTDSAVLSPNIDISKEVRDGSSVLTDVFQFGSLVYEVISGKRWNFDLFRPEVPGKELPNWPEVSQLPAVQDLDYGTLIFKCWTREFENMSAVIVDVSNHEKTWQNRS